MADSNTILSLVGVGQRYGSLEVLSDVNLQVERGHFVSLLGPSGCGKSTLLNIIAGINAQTAGQIRLNGEVVDARPPYERDIGMVFQDYALFPHLSVFDNVAFGIRMRRKASQADIATRVREMLELVRLSGLEKRFPSQLSGGQQQRVAIARALAPRPSLLLMDEPLSNLDAKVRESTRLELKAIQRSTGVTTVYVTHDQEEAMSLSDRVVVMRAGRIEQIGAPREVYWRPATRFAADFVGRANILEGSFSDDIAGAMFNSSGGLKLRSVMPEGNLQNYGAVVIRPEQIHIRGAAAATSENSLPAKVVGTQFTGALTLLSCRSGDQDLHVLCANTRAADAPQVGDDVELQISALSLHPLVGARP